MVEWPARQLVAGAGRGVPLVLTEPLSMWGGLDPHSGAIIDQRHPQWGANVAGRVLILTSGRGSSSASSVLHEAIRNGVAPAAIVLAEVDAILALGAVVARELYGAAPPVVVLAPADYEALAQLVKGQAMTIDVAGGMVQIYASKLSR